MKNKILSILSILFLLSIQYVQITFAQDSPQFSLPEGATARFGKGSVRQVLYSPDGKHLAVASSIGIWIYDVENYKEIALLAGHTRSITCIAFSPDGKTLASGTRDKTVRLWDMATYKHKQTLTGHLHGIYSLAFSPDGNILASGSTGERDGEQIFGVEIRLWDTTSGKHMHKLAAQGQVNSLTFSPDGKTIASGEGWPKYAIRIFDVDTGNEMNSIAEHSEWINSVTFGQEKNTLLSSSYDGSIRVWDYKSTKQTHVIFETARVITVATYNPDVNLIATGHSSGIYILDATSGIVKNTLDTESVVSLTFSPDGKTLTSAHHGRKHIIVWDVDTWKEKRSLTDFTHPTFDITFSPDNNILASGGADPYIYLWDVNTAEKINQLIENKDPVDFIAFSSDGHSLISGSNHSTVDGSYATVIRWDAVTYTKNLVFSTKNKITTPLALVKISPDMSNFACVSLDVVQMWDIQNRNLKFTLQPYAGNFFSIAWSPDGKIFATGSVGVHIGEDQSVRYKGISLWDVETGEQQEVFEAETGSVGSLAFSPDGKTLASDGLGTDYAVLLWDVSTGEAKFVLKGHTLIIMCVAFSPNGNILASGSADNTIRLWDVTTGKHIRTLNGHTEAIKNITFSSDGKKLASCSNDGTVYLWNVVSSANAIEKAK